MAAQTARWLVGLLAAIMLSSAAACAWLVLEPEAEDVLAWKAQTTELRGLEFRERVRFERVNGQQAAEVIRAELRSQLSDDFVDRYRDAYAVLGLLPPDIDLFKAMEDLYAGELTGLYSPRLRTMFVRTGHEDPNNADSGETVVHELVHALQHQHYPDTIAMLQGLRQSDDVATAIGAMVEGDASFTMLGVSGAASGLGRDIGSAETMRSLILGGNASSAAFAAAPRLLRDSLFFPYAHGTVYAAHRYADGGNEGLNRALVDTPVSTRQVLYFDSSAPVEFVGLPLGELAKRLEGRGCRLGESNIGGALTLNVLFDEYAPESRNLDSLLRNWSGDRFAHIDCEGTWELIWHTRWAHARNAKDFAERFEAIAKRVAAASPLSGTPRVFIHGRSAIVLSPGVLDLANVVQNGTVLREYTSLEDWLADDCFPDSPCP